MMLGKKKKTGCFLLCFPFHPLLLSSNLHCEENEALYSNAVIREKVWPQEGKNLPSPCLGSPTPTPRIHLLFLQICYPLSLPLTVSIFIRLFFFSISLFKDRATILLW